MLESHAELKITIMQMDGGVYIGASGSGGQNPQSHFLDPSDASLCRERLDARERLDVFTAGVRCAAESGVPLDAALQDEAYALHNALFQGAMRDVAQRLLEASRPNPLLVRLMIHDPGLKAVPWEAFCAPGTHAGFLGTSDQMLLARGVTSNEPGEACRVSGSVRILAVAPLPAAAAALRELENALAEPIKAGAVDWLPPITGEAASMRYLFDSLRRRESPHVIHFIGHGKVDAQGKPLLCLKEKKLGQEEEWILAESLAHELGASFGGTLRLAVLEACESAGPGAFGSAAEVLASGGAQAAVAYLWRVQADVAHQCSRELYRTLTGAKRAKGDIVESLAAARRTLLQTNAAAFSPVVYLRSARSALFDFQGRALSPSALPDPTTISPLVKDPGPRIPSVTTVNSDNNFGKPVLVAIMAAVIVVAVFIKNEWHPGSSDPTVDPLSRPVPTTATVKVDKPLKSLVKIPSTAITVTKSAPSVDDKKYDPMNLFDGDNKTGWCVKERVKEKYVEIVVTRRYQITQVKVRGGWPYYSEEAQRYRDGGDGDMWNLCLPVTKATVSWNHHEQESVSFNRDNDRENPKSIEIPPNDGLIRVWMDELGYGTPDSMRLACWGEVELWGYEVQ